MATKTFSGRADAEKILLADALARQEYGLSFGQYCSGVLVDYICETGAPRYACALEEKRRCGHDAEPCEEASG